MNGRKSLPLACLACLAALVGSCIPQQTGDSNYIGPGTFRATTAPATTHAATQPTTAPVVTGPAGTQPAAGALELSVQRSILMGLANNRSLAVERLAPDIRRTFEAQERAAFDPDVTAEVSAGRAKARVAGGGESIADAVSGSAAVGTFLPTGTTLSAGVDIDLLDSSLYSDDLAGTRLGVSATQALLRGSSVRANLARLNQARIDTRASQYELRGFAEALTAQIEETYWNCTLAARRIDILTNSLALAEQQEAETKERIKIGRLAETELAAAQAEVALRREDLINARSALAQVRLLLLRLLNPTGPLPWDRTLVLLNPPAEPQVRLADVEQHVAVALRMRPDLNQARLAVQRDELEVVRTADGLLPRLDLFLTLGKTGYAKSVGRTFERFDEDHYDVLAGARFEQPPLNREARALHGRAVLTRRQAVAAVENLAQLVEQDVRSAYIEVQRAREQIVATAVTRRFQEEKLRAETEKFKVGKSTSLLVGQAQRDLLASQIAEIEALVTFLKDMVELHRLEGSLLERRGIVAPGRQPATMEAPK